MSGFNNGHRNGWRIAEGKLQSMTPWASSHKDDHGIYQDAVIVLDGRSTWLYHGNAIAQFDGEKWLKSTCGWDTRTTRARLNSLPGPRIYRSKGKSFTNDDEEWVDAQIMFNYHRIDGWRGYTYPLTCVLGASDTGNWSDSPCRPEEELKSFQDFLLSHKIKSSQAWTETSNIFCIKRWIQVHPSNLVEAIRLADEYLANTTTYLLHKGD